MNYFLIINEKGKGQTRELISERLANIFFEAKTPKIGWIKRNKNGEDIRRSVSLNDVSQIISEDEYYDLHPEERPLKQNNQALLEAPISYTKAQRGKALQSMLRGIERYISDHSFRKNYNAEYIRERILKRIELEKLSPDISKPFNINL